MTPFELFSYVVSFFLGVAVVPFILLGVLIALMLVVGAFLGLFWCACLIYFKIRDL